MPLKFVLVMEMAVFAILFETFKVTRATERQVMTIS